MGMHCPASDLRSEIARHWKRPLYVLAAQVGIHQANLSGILHERLPLKPEIASRILFTVHHAAGVEDAEVKVDA
jgi:hypothetical protein